MMLLFAVVRQSSGVACTGIIARTIIHKLVRQLGGRKVYNGNTMLYLHQSNRLEQLAYHFAALQRADPLPPLETEQVVVQNIGMGRWLSLQTARINGITANLRYLFPAEMTWELMRAVLTDVPARDPVAPATLRWRLLALFLQEPQRWPDLQRYLDTGMEGAWQLAGQLAKVYDQYLFFRPEWISQWEADKGSSDDWQARLWWQVAGEGELTHWVRLQARFAHAIAVADLSSLPRRISFFSVPVLSPGYVQLIAQVAKHIDIHFYLLNPSQVYWGDIASEKQRYKQDAAFRSVVEVGNPLLASWGRQGRDFFDLLLEVNADDDGLVPFVEPEGNTLLQHVQADILHLRMPQPFAVPPAQEGSGGQASIQFHVCHAPMREAEVLYQHLLALFAANPDLTPADVVVMTPDIDTYAPYLEAVFATADPPLPYSIADSSPRFAQGLLNLCRQLLALPQGRCDTESVLALLEFEEVRQQLGLDEAGVMQCRHWIREVDIRWGAAAGAREALGGASTPEHTWRYGLDRLLLGYAMPGEELFAGVLPYNSIEGSAAELLGRLQHWLDAIFELVTWGNQEQVMTVWEQRLRQVLHVLVGDDAPLQPVWQALENLRQTQERAGFDLPMTWNVFRSALAEQLDRRSESEGFLGQGITFCALMPMRTVPFRFVALLGMNDGVFPRRDVRASFDRMALQWRRGDRLKRDEDRYLFLESILSARDWLYISYVGRSALDNSELPPAGLVSELQDYLERCVDGARQALVHTHRLQAFSGQSARNSGKVVLPFWNGERLPEPDAAYRHPTLTDLVRFYRHPARQFLRIRLGLSLDAGESALPTREPFVLEAYRDADIRACIFQQLQRGHPAAEALPLLRAQGLLPHGQPGNLLFDQEVAVTERFYARVQPLPLLTRTAFGLALEEFQLSGLLDGLADDGRRVYLLDTPSYWQWLDIWLNHLVLNALPGAGSRTTVFAIERDHQLAPVADAAAQLHQLLVWYWQGLQEPLAFFPKTAFNLMKQHKIPDISKAMSTWKGSGGFQGEGEKAEYRLLYRNVNPLETQSDLFMTIADGVFGALLRATDREHGDT